MSDSSSAACSCIPSAFTVQAWAGLELPHPPSPRPTCSSSELSGAGQGLCTGICILLCTLSLANTAVKTSPSSDTNLPWSFLLKGDREGRLGWQLLPVNCSPPQWAQLLWKMRRGAEHALCSSHTSPFMPALVAEKVAEYISTNLKEQGEQTERGVGFILPPTSSLLTSEEIPTPQFVESCSPFPPFFKQLYF